jgi:hypothetical protein
MFKSDHYYILGALPVQVASLLVHHFRDWYSSAAANFGWIRGGPSRTGATRENTRCGLGALVSPCLYRKQKWALNRLVTRNQR